MPKFIFLSQCVKMLCDYTYICICNANGAWIAQFVGWTTEEYPIASRLNQGIFLVYKVVKTGPGTHRASHSKGTGSFPLPENKVVGSESYLHLVQRLRMNGAVPPPPHIT